MWYREPTVPGRGAVLKNRTHFLRFPLPDIGRAWSAALAQTAIGGVVLWHLISLHPSKWTWHRAQAQEDCRRLGDGAAQDTHLDAQLKSREAGHAWSSFGNKSLLQGNTLVCHTHLCPVVPPLPPCQGPQLQNQSCWSLSQL